MKRIIEENGKEKVIVQGKDLRFLDSQARTPKDLKKFITFEHINVNNQEVEYTFDDENFVKYVDRAYFIIDHDEFENMSYDEACAKFELNRKKIEEKIKEIKLDLKKKEDVTKKRHDLDELSYYDQSILYGLSHEKYQNRIK